MAAVMAVYFSPTGTSEKGAVSIAEGLCSNAGQLDITLTGKVYEKCFDEEDIVVFGAPVYKGRIFQGVKKRLEHIKGTRTPCVVTVTYGNRDYEDALLELFDIVSENGFVPIAGAALIGEHTYGRIQIGRPDDKDLKEDSAFASKVLKKWRTGNMKLPILPGNRPYVEKEEGTTFIPLTNEKCTKCGLCAEKCPEAAIDIDNYSEIDKAKCIGCFRCIRICPAGAKNMDVKAYIDWAAAFSQKLSFPRKNEYFI